MKPNHLKSKPAERRIELLAATPDSAQIFNAGIFTQASADRSPLSEHSQGRSA